MGRRGKGSGWVDARAALFFFSFLSLRCRGQAVRRTRLFPRGEGEVTRDLRERGRRSGRESLLNPEAKHLSVIGWVAATGRTLTSPSWWRVVFGAFPYESGGSRFESHLCPWRHRVGSWSPFAPVPHPVAFAVKLLSQHLSKLQEVDAMSRSSSRLPPPQSSLHASTSLNHAFWVSRYLLQYA